MGYYDKRCKVVNEKGLHARPSRLISEEAKKIGVPSRTVFMKCPSSGSEADVLMPLEILMLAATFNEDIIVYTENAKYKKAVDVIVNVIQTMVKYDD